MHRKELKEIAAELAAKVSQRLDDQRGERCLVKDCPRRQRCADAGAVVLPMRRLRLVKP